MRSNIALIFFIFSIIKISSQPAFKKTINLPNTGLVEDVKQIGPNRILMTFSVYAYVVDTSLNVITARNITGVPTMGYPRIGSIRVKDGVILGYTNNSYTGVAFYKFKTDFSSFIAGYDGNFGQPSGLSNTWDSKSYIEDTTTKVATFVGGRSNCAEASLVKFDSVLNVIYSKTLTYFGGSGKYICFDYSPNSLYLLHNDVSAGVAFVARTNYSLSVQKAYSIAVGDSLTQSTKMIRTSDDKLLITGRAYFKGQVNPTYFLLKCDTTGTNISWCKTYNTPSGGYFNYGVSLLEVGGKYYTGGDTPLGGIILEIDANTGSLLNYNAQMKYVVSLSKFNNKQIICTNDYAIPTFYHSKNPMNISSSCDNTTYTIITSPLTPTLSLIPISQFLTTVPFIGGGPPFSTANLAISNSINTSCQTTVGMEKHGNLASDHISIFPNPANNNLNISSLTEISKLEIINTIGQVALTKNNINATTTSIDLSTLSQGVYFVHLNTDSGTSIRKIIKD